MWVRDFYIENMKMITQFKEIYEVNYIGPNLYR